MAVEIFSATPSTGGTARAYGSEISITAPSDIYFGKGAPGIAYFEKAGADLRVTLLDGQQVVLRDFFVIGPEGDASRLLDGVGGPVEVTGLLAPEPFQPETGTIHPVEVDPVDTGHADTGHADAGAVVTAPEAEAAAPVQAEAAPAGAEAADGTGGWSFGGVGLDRLAFSTALGAILGEIIVSDDGGGKSSHADAASSADAPAADTADASAVTDEVHADDAATTSDTAADPAALVADLISSDSPSIDIAALMSFDSGTAVADAAAPDSSGAEAAGSDSGLAGGMFDSASELSGTDADSAATTASLPDSDTTLADLMQGSDDVHGA